jgi:hypothetical protein
VSDGFNHLSRASPRWFWGLRMADSIYKEQFIEAGTMMEEIGCRLLAANEKSPVKH